MSGLELVAALMVAADLTGLKQQTSKVFWLNVGFLILREIGRRFFLV